MPGDDKKGSEAPEAPVGLTEAAIQEKIDAAVNPLKTENARLSEALILRDSRDFVIAQMRSAEIPDITKVRLVESLSMNPPVKDGILDKEAFTTKIAEAVKAEAAYLAEVTGSGRVQGMNSATSPLSGGPEEKPEEITAGLKSGFGRLGLSESVATKAATGRGN